MYFSDRLNMKLKLNPKVWKIAVLVGIYIIIAFFICVTIAVCYDWNREHKRQISEKMGYCYNSKGGYIYDLATDEIIIPSVSWIVEPKGNDSIAIFHWNDKRGYFNINSGEIISQPQYEAAWMFRSGVGGVAKNDSIYFIGLDGKPINNKKFARIKGEDYIYNGDYCVLKIGDRYGAIDKSGEWVIRPEWDYVEVATNGLLIAWQNGWSYTVYDKDSIMPFPNKFDIIGDTIYSYSDSIRIYIRNKTLEK